MKLTRTTIYALNAALALSRHEPGRAIPCRAIAKQGHMPERFLLQILRTLVSRGILGSNRGVEGGYFLTRRPEQITLLDIVDVFERSLHSTSDATTPTPSNVDKCLLRALEQTSEAARQELRKLTLADLLKASGASETIA